LTAVATRDIFSPENLIAKELFEEIVVHLNIERQLAQEAILEFLRFAKLSLLTPSKVTGKSRFIPVVQIIDQIWHFYILQTREYAALCESLCPGRFLHHRTFLYERHLESNPKVEELHQEDLSWLASYVFNFGEFTERTVVYWRVPQLLMAELSWPLSKLNDFSNELIKKSQP
jgi:hypothetical protein